jgi:hypothetical protein
LRKSVRADEGTSRVIAVDKWHLHLRTAAITTGLEDLHGNWFLKMAADRAAFPIKAELNVISLIEFQPNVIEISL